MHDETALNDEKASYVYFFLNDISFNMYMWMVMRTVVLGSLGPEPVRRVPEPVRRVPEPVRRMPEPVRRMPDDDLVESFSSDVFSVISGDSNPLSCENFAATKT